jgi:uncharacterized protein Usg
MYLGNPLCENQLILAVDSNSGLLHLYSLIHTDLAPDPKKWHLLWHFLSSWEEVLYGHNHSWFHMLNSPAKPSWTVCIWDYM